jgi:hypothetical protein
VSHRAQNFEGMKAQELVTRVLNLESGTYGELQGRIHQNVRAIVSLVQAQRRLIDNLLGVVLVNERRLALELAREPDDVTWLTPILIVQN